jgi:hypothetical protein
LLAIVASCAAIYTAAIMPLRIMSVGNCAANTATSIAIAGFRRRAVPASQSSLLLFFERRPIVSSSLERHNAQESSVRVV